MTGNIEAVKKHITADNDVNAKGGDGSTTLHLAAFRSYTEVVELLVGAGADLNAKGVVGVTPLHYAENKEVADLLIAKGADVNAKGGRVGGTPLHNAALEGHNEVAALLIDKGADVNANDRFGKTPLDRSIELRRIEPPPLDGHKLDSDIIQSLLRKHGGKTAEELKAEGK